MYTNAAIAPVAHITAHIAEKGVPSFQRVIICWTPEKCVGAVWRNVPATHQRRLPHRENTCSIKIDFREDCKMEDNAKTLVYDNLRQLTALSECIADDAGDLDELGDEFNLKRINRLAELTVMLHDGLQALQYVYDQMINKQ